MLCRAMERHRARRNQPCLDLSLTVFIQQKNVTHLKTFILYYSQQPGSSIPFLYYEPQHQIFQNVSR